MVTTISLSDDVSVSFRGVPGDERNDAYRIAVSWEAPSEEMAAELVDAAIDDVVDEVDGLEHGLEYRVYFIKNEVDDTHTFAAEAAQRIAERLRTLYNEYRQEFDSPAFDEAMESLGV